MVMQLEHAQRSVCGLSPKTLFGRLRAQCRNVRVALNMAFGGSQPEGALRLTEGAPRGPVVETSRPQGSSRGLAREAAHGGPRDNAQRSRFAFVFA